MESVQSLEKVHTPGTVQTAGVLCAVGGAGWLVDGVCSVIGGNPVGWRDVRGLGGVLDLVQSLLLIGVAGLAFSGAAPGWFGGISLGLALLGRVDFVAEIHSLIIGYDSDLLPLGALVTAVGMTLVGIAVLRAKRWGGWQRFAPLLAGV